MWSPRRVYHDIDDIRTHGTVKTVPYGLILTLTIVLTLSADLYHLAVVGDKAVELILDVRELSIDAGGEPLADRSRTSPS